MSGDMTQLYPFLFPFFPFLSRKALAFSFALLVMYISCESHEVVDGNCWITEVVEYLLRVMLGVTLAAMWPILNRVNPVIMYEP